MRCAFGVFGIRLIFSLALSILPTHNAQRITHNVLEATFKALARALKTAVSVDARVQGVPSTKGTLSE